MDEEVRRLAAEAVAHREAGNGLVDAVALLVEEHPGLREAPIRLALVLREAFGLSIPHLKSIAAWVQGVLRRDLLEEWLREES